MKIIQFAIVFIISLFLVKQLQPQQTQQNHMITAFLISVIASFTLASYNNELFHFEVTPYNKTCISNDRCPQCCPPGFNGMRIGFEYSSDEERMNNCPHRQPSNLKSPVSDYDKLGNTWDYGMQKESYCQACPSGSGHKQLDQTWANKESYCQACPSGSGHKQLDQTWANKESYCSSQKPENMWSLTEGFKSLFK